MTFIPQTFEDLVVEKEVAIRRKLAKESVIGLGLCRFIPSSRLTFAYGIRFNKRREDFPDLRSYNDYLQEVEDLSKSHLIPQRPPPLTHHNHFSKQKQRDVHPAFNLINEIDIPETQARVAAYRKENAGLIELNQQREEAYAHALKEQEEAERRERQLRAEELRRAEEEERDAREGERRALIDNLAEHSDADAARLVAQARAEALKRAAVRTATAHQAVAQMERQQGAAGSSAHVLRSRAALSAVVPDVPHVPLTDSYHAYEDLYSVRPSYFDPASEAVRRDKEGIMRAGGYFIEEAWERALRCAVAGLEIPSLSGVSTSHTQEPTASGLNADVAMASV
jgi:CDK-activating kinase assembly factor MAT1